MAAKITYKGTVVPLRITYKQAMFDFRALGLNLLAIFKDEQAIMTIMSDDEVMIRIWYEYVKPYASTFESAIEDLLPEDMHKFKEAFWDEVINFTAPPMRPILVSMMEQVQTALASPQTSLNNQS